MIERLQALKQRKGTFPDGAALRQSLQDDYDLQREIEDLTLYFLGRAVAGCTNCYMDAFFELLNYPIEKAMERENCKYHLLAGVVLYDVVNYDRQKICTNANLTNELAEYHLRTNHSCRQYFDRLPEEAQEPKAAAKAEPAKAKVKAEAKTKAKKPTQTKKK